MLRFLREKNAHSTKRFSTTTVGAHGASFDICTAMSMKRRVTSGVVLSIAKCLPYELPSLSNIPHDLDPYARRATYVQSSNKTTYFESDLYGVGSQFNTARVPLMCYPGLCEQQESLMRHPTSAAYVVTGVFH